MISGLDGPEKAWRSRPVGRAGLVIAPLMMQVPGGNLPDSLEIVEFKRRVKDSMSSGNRLSCRPLMNKTPTYE